MRDMRKLDDLLYQISKLRETDQYRLGKIQAQSRNVDQCNRTESRNGSTYIWTQIMTKVILQSNRERMVLSINFASQIDIYMEKH